MINFVSAFAKNISNEKLAAVVFTGLTVVFIALIILIFCVWLFGKIFQIKDNSKKNKTIKTKQESVNVTSKTPIIQDAIDDEVIAVITAAIAAISANEGKKFVLRSIRRAENTSRLAWAKAGIIDNVKPF